MKKKKKTPAPKSDHLNRLCGIKKVLEEAITDIRPGKWIKRSFRHGVYGTDNVRVCAVGAVKNAQVKLKTSVPEDDVRSFLDAAVPGPMGIIGYNDRDTTTVDDVKKVFKAALKKVDQQIMQEAKKG